MGIKNPTLAHFRHFRHFRHFSSLLTNENRVSGIEYPVSDDDMRHTTCDIRNCLYNCRERTTNQPFFAKQTQFSGCPNERNLLSNNELRTMNYEQRTQKQTQSKPIIRASFDLGQDGFAYDCVC